LAEVLKANGARVAFLTPQPIEDKRPDPDADIRNQSLRKFSDGLKEVADKEGAVFVDQFDPYMAVLLRERPNSPTSFVGGGDAVHPGPIGHTVMAWAILKGLGAQPLVSSVELDVTTQKVKTEGCQAKDVKVNGSTVSFERADEALPMPIDEKATPALKLAPILEDLDSYTLQIKGLPPGNYQLSIDSEPAGKTTSEQLAKGWNLATQAGPITKQAQHVLALVFQKNTAELSRLDQQIADSEAEIESARKPLPHRFELKPADL
jgi:hypothetical protein